MTRTASTAYVFLPIGVLFGITAASMGWSAVDVLLASGIGVSSSAQFSLLNIYADGVPFATSLLLVILINIRYVLISISQPKPEGLSLPCKLIAAHLTTDASFALEEENDTDRERLEIRTLVWIYWVASSLAGVALLPTLTKESISTLSGFTFPASALLLWFGVDRGRRYVIRAGMSKGAVLVFAAIAISMVSYFLIGRSLFWIPSVLFGAGLLSIGTRVPTRPGSA